MSDTAPLPPQRRLTFKAPSNVCRVRPFLALTTIISGGQTGVDAAGLRTGLALGLRTGGWAPRGWRTQSGPQPVLGSLYGLTQHTSSDYAPRTDANVRDADATIRIAENFATPGEQCTLRAIERHGKPTAAFHRMHLDAPHVALLIAFLDEHRVTILNVAGNSEKSSPGIGLRAEVFLRRALMDRANVLPPLDELPALDAPR